MQNISISTMKEDLAKEDTPSQEKKGGWFDFMAKHKKTDPSSPPSDGASSAREGLQSITENNPVESTPASVPDENGMGGVLDKELEEFKEESEQLTEKPFAESGGSGQPETGIAGKEGSADITTQMDQTEAPLNLPVSDKPSFSENLSDKSTPVETTGQAEAEIGQVGEGGGIKETLPSGGMSNTSAEEGEGLSIPDIQGKLKEALGGEINTATVSKMKPINEGVGALQGGIGQEMAKGQKSDPLLDKENDSSVENPFSSRIQMKEPEKKSLLSSVESALNYSASPEFSEERENQGKTPEESGPIVDLRKKTATGPMGAIMSNKKLLVIGGGAIILVLIGVTLMFVLNGRSKTEVQKTPVATTPVNNQNQNTNPIAPIKTVTQMPPTVSTKKVLNDAIEINFESEKDISDELEKYRQGKKVAKQTQLVFVKSNGSSATFQDLMNATGIMVPRNILTQPSAEAALIFVDFFHGNTIFGLVVPVKDNEELAMSKLKDWESTMIIDLGDLWKGVNIDNKGAYFADSQVFAGGRFALIDKKQGLSLDYLFQKGYVLITPGKDSMMILKNQFNPPIDSSDSGIKWEEESNTTVSGVNGNSNAALGTNGNMNSQ